MDELEKALKSLEIQKLKLEIKDLEIPNQSPKLWNSLEWVKLVASLILPIVLLIITFNASNRLEEIKDNQKALADQNKIAIENNKRIYDMRFTIYQQIAFRLNEIYCYFSYVGKWKELSPVRIIENKRFCDEIMYSNQSLFNPEFFSAYTDFMDAVYKTYSTQGQDAKLMTDLKAHKEYYKGSTTPWQNDWDNLFGIDTGLNEFDIRKDVHKKYNHLLTLLSKELNIREVLVNNQFKDFKPE